MFEIQLFFIHLEQKKHIKYVCVWACTMHTMTVNRNHRMKKIRSLECYFYHAVHSTIKFIEHLKCRLLKRYPRHNWVRAEKSSEKKGQEWKNSIRMMHLNINLMGLMGSEKKGFKLFMNKSKRESKRETRDRCRQKSELGQVIGCNKKGKEIREWEREKINWWLNFKFSLCIPSLFILIFDYSWNERASCSLFLVVARDGSWLQFSKAAYKREI